VTITLEAVKTTVLRMAASINAPQTCLPTFGRTVDGARPHVEVGHDERLHWVVVERGREFERRTTQELSELLRWVFGDVTWSMASDWELHHRVPGQDSRILLFTKQLELLGQLDERWRDEYRNELVRRFPELGVG